MQQTVAALPAGATIVEIGTAQGGGLHLMATSRKSPVDTVIHSFDPYPGDGVPLICRTNENVFSHGSFSEEGAANWPDLCGNQVDLLVIDGSHTLKAVCNDYDSWRSWLGKHGAILFHDYDEKKRAGMSHPGIKVFCDALVASVGSEIAQQHVGRYLFLRMNAAMEVKLADLKNAAFAWISGALGAAGRLRAGFANREIIFQDILDGHSRIRVGSGKPRSPRSEGANDAAIVLFLAYEALSLHETLIRLLPDARRVLKWIEYLEMFLHARQWSFALSSDPTTHPILSSIWECQSVDHLSRFCADIAVFGGITESIFSAEP